MNRRFIYILLFIIYSSIAQAQIGIGVEPPAASSEMELSSTQRGVLIPRLTDAQMTTLGTGATATEQSLLIYNTTQKKFYFWTGAAWQQLGGNCIEITDEDGDTKIQVEKTANENIIRASALGSEKLVVDKTKVTMTNGNLSINSGSLVFGSNYTLPSYRGSDTYVLGINNSGSLEWRNPSAALGLVVGIETSSFTNTDQMTNINSYTYYVRVMPWSTITVTKMAFLINGVGGIASTPEIGIYDNSGKRLTYGTGSAIASTTPRIVEIPVTKYTLIAGQVYWFALTDKTGTMNISNQIFANTSAYSCRREAVTSLPATTTFPLSDADKGFWMAAY